MKLVIIISLSLAFFAVTECFLHHGPWYQLKSANKRVTQIDTNSFEDALDYCEQIGGNLISFHDTREAMQVSNEIMKLPGRMSNFWIGLRQYKGDCAWKWTSGDIFHADRFNFSSDSNYTDHHQLCGLIRISSGPLGYNYSIVERSCQSNHPALCEAASNTYEALTIAAVTLSGFCLIVILVYVAFKWQRSRMTVYATRESRPDPPVVSAGEESECTSPISLTSQALPPN